jgi:hypothetical protein
LIQAKRENRGAEQVYYLDRLGDVYLEKRNWVQAAKIFNCELAVLEQEASKESESCRDENDSHAPVESMKYYGTLLTKMESIETRLLATPSNDNSSNAGYISAFRKELARVRERCEERFQQCRYMKTMHDYTHANQHVTANDEANLNFYLEKYNTIPENRMNVGMDRIIHSLRRSLLR